MTVALVFAMSGGAYAAGKYLITSTKQISPKVLKSLQGKAGSAGANGAQGPAGPTGPQGAAGAKGENGTSGANGVSVTSSVEAAGTNCKAGGSKFVAASGTTYACNGEKGKEGKEGTFGAGQSLPSGQTLRGAYGASGFATEGFGTPGEGEAVTGVSFALPTTGHTENSDGIRATIYVKKGEATPAGCKGEHNYPGAEPGKLCIFSVNEINVAGVLNEPAYGGNSVYGFTVTAYGAAAGRIVAQGTWAATAE